MRVPSLGREDHLETEVANYPSILAWKRIPPWTEEPGRLQLMGSQRIGHGLETKQQQQQNLGKIGTCYVDLFLSFGPRQESR